MLSTKTWLWFSILTILPCLYLYVEYKEMSLIFNFDHLALFRFICWVQRDCWNSFWQVEEKSCNSAEANQDVPQFSKFNFPQETKGKYTNTNCEFFWNFHTNLAKLGTICDSCTFCSAPVVAFFFTILVLRQKVEKLIRSGGISSKIL